MPIRAQRILWPTDFSDLSLQAARYARGLRDLFDAELHVLHIVTPPLAPDISITLPADVPTDYNDDRLLAACRQRLDDLVNELFADVPRLVSDTFIGHPWSGICDYAERHHMDLLVVSTHGRTGLQHVLIGSTAERIVQHAPCPVLVVKNPEQDFGQ